MHTININTRLDDCNRQNLTSLNSCVCMLVLLICVHLVGANTVALSREFVFNGEHIKLRIGVKINNPLLLERDVYFPYLYIYS